MLLAARILALAVLSGLATTPAVGPGRAADRSVTIIEGVPEPSPELTPAAPEPPPPAPPPPSPQADDAAAPAVLRTNNPAGVHVDVTPGAVLPVGTDVVFRVGTDHPGYLVLVDINADKTATQIYPNVMSLAKSPVHKEATNLLKPGTTVAIPDLKNPFARFVFKTEPPLGRGVIVAILSEQPVQLIDVPSLPSDLSSAQASVDALDEALRKLLVSQAGRPGEFTPNAWSLAAVEYVIR